MNGNETVKKRLSSISDFIDTHHLASPFRRIKEMLVLEFISKKINVDKKQLSFYCQPVLFVLLKTALLFFIILKLYGLNIILGNFLETCFKFLKLDEIYNFTMPGRKFFSLSAKILIILLVSYHGFYFLIKQIESLFSSFIINKKDNKIYLLKNYFIKNDLYIFFINDINPVIIKQNLISKIFGMGTIVLNRKNDEKIKISSIMNIKRAISELT